MDDRHEFYTNLVVYLLVKVIRGGKKKKNGKLVFIGLCGMKIPEICKKKKKKKSGIKYCMMVCR
jgi:hypothetical protein